MRKNFAIVILFLFLLSACQQFDALEDLEQVKYDAEYALPIVDSEISLKELIENVEEGTTISIDEKGKISFHYSGDVISQTSDDLFGEINESLPPVIPVTNPRMALPFASPDGIEVDRVDLKAGELIYFFENRHPDPVSVNITLPQVLKNGEAMRFRHSLPGYNGSGNPPRFTNFLLPASLKDYSIVAERDSIYIEYEAVRSSGESDTLSSFLLRIQDLAFTYAEGYLGNQIHQGGRDTIEIDFFDSWVQGDIYFQEPRIAFDIENSFGIPTRSVVNLFNVITVRGEVLPLESEFINEGIDFPFPGIDAVGNVERKTFNFTKDNSNIDQILGAGPVAVDYDVDALTNPDNNTDIRGFITDSSYYRVRINVELPLYGSAADFVAQDTFEIDFTSYEDITDAEFKIVADNSLPLAVDVQAYFLTPEGEIVDSLLDERQRIIAAAPVNEEGMSSQTVRKITFAPFVGERFDNIRRSSQLLLSAAFSTTQDGEVPVRPLADQTVRIRIGSKLGVKRE